MTPELQKTKSIREFPTPKTVHQVRQFLGLTGFFRHFIRDYALMAKPLTNLTRKDQKWTWESKEQKSFDSLKEKLISRPVLAVYNPNAETEVHTDASQLGLGGILMQKFEDKFHPVAYYSRNTTDAEQKYHSYELETHSECRKFEKVQGVFIGDRF